MQKAADLRTKAVPVTGHKVDVLDLPIATRATKEKKNRPTNRQRILNAFNCQPVDRPPIWLMRQAGRCLPEYRALKEKYSFRDLIRIPELATEVTLQPIRRFGFDAAILFSDILVIPEALGQSFQFRDTGGVQMDFTLRDKNEIEKLRADGVNERLQYVADALKLIKKSLGDRTGLLGFAGSPWTLANFMLEGGSAKQHVKALELFRNDRAAYDLLAEKLTGAVTEFLQLQIDCGVDAIQIFDSVGGILPSEEFEAASGRWIKDIVAELRSQVPVIVFSKGSRNWKSLAQTGANVIGIDHEIEITDAAKQLPTTVALQGNFNPDLLRDATTDTVISCATQLLEKMQRRNGHIFNLGHGVPPDAKLENLQALVYTVQHFA